VTTGGYRRLRPGPLAVAAALVALQGLAGVAYGGYLAVRALVDDPAESVVGAEIGALLLVAGGAGLIACARGLLGARGWARAPVITVQLLAVLIGINYVQTPAPGPTVGVALLVLAGAVLYALATPAARLAFDEE
jgi:hypothetical protein